MHSSISISVENQRWKMENEDSVYVLQMFIFFFLKMHDEVEDVTSNGRGWRLRFVTRRRWDQKRKMKKEDKGIWD